MPERYDDRREIYFEDLNMGDQFISIARTITESDFINFAGLIGWYDPLHCDAVYSEGPIFKRNGFTPHI